MINLAARFWAFLFDSINDLSGFSIPDALAYVLSLLFDNIIKSSE